MLIWWRRWPESARATVAPWGKTIGAVLAGAARPGRWSWPGGWSALVGAVAGLAPLWLTPMAASQRVFWEGWGVGGAFLILLFAVPLLTAYQLWSSVRRRPLGVPRAAALVAAARDEFAGFVLGLGSAVAFWVRRPGRLGGADAYASCTGWLHCGVGIWVAQIPQRNALGFLAIGVALPTLGAYMLMAMGVVLLMQRWLPRPNRSETERDGLPQ